MAQPTQLDSGTIEAIVGGFHRDPFAVLGPHPQGDQTAIRIYEPDADSVTILQGKKRIACEQLDAGGLFEAFTKTKKSYSLEINYKNGTMHTQHDIYAMPSTIGEMDLYLFGEGNDMQMYEKMGAHVMEVDGVQGTRFAVWAPGADRVSVVGNFNNWDGRRHVMRLHPSNGIWELFIPKLGVGEVYKYEIKTGYRGYVVNKTDPVGFYQELRPNTASVVWDIDQYEWNDQSWIESRSQKNRLDGPINVYEVHLGSWQRLEGNKFLSYDDMIERLIPYVKWMGYTHIELLPVAEHPFDGSWGYQVVGYFAPTSRFGNPTDFMRFVDACHQADIGVILDWVPAHFPKDQHGLGFFDGTHLYEHADPRKGEHPDWGTLIFNFDRNEVRQFLISNALFWIEKYHIDGLRVDAVASMLYLDFSREADQWVPNVYGGRENIGAINFLREFNTRVHDAFPSALTIAEESTSWPGVTNPVTDNGLGFDLKWNMGWMHDTLQYMSTDPVYRAYHHGTITFSMLYAFSEKFMLPFSHDEVVHLKKSMVDKMPGDNWQKFASLRLVYGYMLSHPGKKLLFMGQEFGQWGEWNENHSLDWHLLQEGWPHDQLQKYVRQLNIFYSAETAFFEEDNSWDGFEWLEVQDSAHSVLAYLRRAKSSGEFVVVVCNFTPIVREYRLGVPQAGVYHEVLSSDDAMFGGSGVVNTGDLATIDGNWRGQPCSIQMTLPPLGVAYFKRATD